MATDYTTLITGSHADKPKFVATVALTTAAISSIGDVAKAMVTAFDVDQAVGVQLDKVGLWVGVTRTVLVASGVTTLDDATYRLLLKAKIATNNWDGTNKQQQFLAYNALASLGVQVVPIDNQDMTYDVIVIGTVTVAFLALVKKNFIPPKPAGVGVNNYWYGSAPYFALDYPNGALLAGLDAGNIAIPF